VYGRPAAIAETTGDTILDRITGSGC